MWRMWTGHEWWLLFPAPYEHSRSALGTAATTEDAETTKLRACTSDVEASPQTRCLSHSLVLLLPPALLGLQTGAGTLARTGHLRESH